MFGLRAAPTTYTGLVAIRPAAFGPFSESRTRMRSSRFRVATATGLFEQAPFNLFVGKGAPVGDGC
jgi:hypothetical protein